MSIAVTGVNIKKLKESLDWKLLLFLILFLDVKIAVKIAAIIVLYLLRVDFNFGFKVKGSRLPLFYPLIIVFAFVGLIVNKSYAAHSYMPTFLYGIFFWMLCLLAMHQVKLSVEQNQTGIIHRTLLIFFIINVICSLFNLAYIVWESGSINPYTYQGEHQKYFLNSGDYIKGLTFDTSTTNAVINAFGVIYFLVRKNAAMALACMAVMLLTASNFTNVILVIILAGLFVFKSSRDQKSLVVICLAFIIVFMVKISPQNNDYVSETVNNIFHRANLPVTQPALANLPITLRPDSLLNPEEKREKTAQLFIDSVNRAQSIKEIKPAKPVIVAANIVKTGNGRIIVPKPDINLEPYQSLTSTPSEQLPLVSFIQQHKNELPVSGKPFKWSGTPGKLISTEQTFAFFKAHPVKLIAGDGMGNFSSKLAFKVSSLNIEGGYPSKYAYISHDFLVNHLDLYLNYFSERAGYHSLLNSPFSVYDQLFAEYGLIGLLVFAVYYLGFFAKNIKTLTYGLPILILTAALLNIDYWFEQLSVLVLFELLLLLDIKETSANNIPNYKHE